MISMDETVFFPNYSLLTQQGVQCIVGATGEKVRQPVATTDLRSLRRTELAQVFMSYLVKRIDAKVPTFVRLIRSMLRRTFAKWESYSCVHFFLAGFG